MGANAQGMARCRGRNPYVFVVGCLRSGTTLLQRMLNVAARIDAYRDASRLRLACLYAFRPRWRDLSLELVQRIGVGSRPPSPRPGVDRLAAVKGRGRVNGVERSLE